MKVLKKVLSIIILVITLFGISIRSNASFSIESASLYSKGEYIDIIRYNGVNVLTNFVVYSKDGIEYPAYCIEREKPGVTESAGYTATVEGTLNNSLVWRVITNGYPYKTPGELGCHSEIEAFVATKQAVYCVLYGNDYNNFERYSAMNDSGERTLNALRQIVTTARNSGNSKPSSNISITPENSNWVVDSINNDYVSKVFVATSEGAISKYTIRLEGQIPEDTIITDTNNVQISSFNGGSKFKILIPIKNLKNNGEFSIIASAEVTTMPVLYGRSPDSNYQDYALTGSKIEIGDGRLNVNYTKNNTKITIEKVDRDTKGPLHGAEFKLLDSEKRDMYSGLLTDEDGEIIIENLAPGKYYIEETKAPDGYTIYKGQIEIELSLNEEFTVRVNNSKTDKTEIEIKKGSMEVVQGEKEVSQSEQTSNTILQEQLIKLTLPKAGM